MAPTTQVQASKPVPRVLVVDDEKGVRHLLRNCFRRLECDVTEAANGDIALSRLEAEPYDLAMIDIRMPGLDGMEVGQPSHGEADEQRYRSLCARYRLLPVAGSDCHGNGPGMGLIGMARLSDEEFGLLKEAAAQRQSLGAAAREKGE